MKVTIKVKHLTMALISIGILLTLLQFVVIPKLQVHYAKKNFEQGNVGGKKSLLAEIDKSAGGNQKWELIRKYMIEYGTDSIVRGFDVYLSSGLTQSSSINSDSHHWSWEQKLPYLEAYIAEGPADGYLVRVAKQLAFYYGSEGNVSQALAALELAETRLKGQYSDQKRLLKLERAKLYAANDESDQADQLLDELTKQANRGDIDFNGEVAQLRAQMLISKGNIKAALTEVNRELETLKKTIAEQKKDFPDRGDITPTKLEQLTSLQVKLEYAVKHDKDSKSIVSGSIKRSDGTPLARVGVYLRDSRDVSHSVTDGEPYQTLTDAQGHYEFEGVLTGNYQLAIGLLFEQINGWTWPTMSDDWIEVEQGQSVIENIELQPLIDIQSPINQEVITGRTVKFEWEPVDGAAYYTLNGNLPIENGTVGTQLKTHIVNSSIELPIESLYHSVNGISYKEDDGKMIIDPSTLLGFANPESRFSWNVEAYDENERLLTRSNGYRLNETTMGALPFFYLKGRELTEADRMLLDGMLDEALIAYKQEYEENNEDLYSLRMIIKVYDAQASIVRKAIVSEALPYLEQMMKVASTEGDIYKLFDYYYEQKDWMKLEHYYKLLIEARNGKVDSFVQSVYGTALMKQRRFEKAIVQFQEALAEDPSHRFIGNYVATDIYWTGNYESALRLASDYPEFAPYEADKPDWLELVQGLEQESRTTGSSHAKELKGTLETYFDGDKDHLNKWMSETKLTAMKALIKALLDVG